MTMMLVSNDESHANLNIHLFWIYLNNCNKYYQSHISQDPVAFKSWKTPRVHARL